PNILPLPYTTLFRSAQPSASANSPYFFSSKGIRNDVSPSTSIFFRKRDSHQAELPHLLKNIFREFCFFVDFNRSWSNDILCKISYHFSYHFLFLRQFKIHYGPPRMLCLGVIFSPLSFKI